MHINKIRIENFKSFYKTTELDFNELTGLWKISGSIGSGKTTIGEAIIFGLYGSIKGKNNKDLISWGQKHGRIEIWCSSYGKEIYINREMNYYGQSPLSVSVQGNPIQFTDKKDAQSQLDDYLDVSKQMMELLCVISFNNFKSLSTMNTKDTRLFLDKVLGFNGLQQYIEECKVVMSELSKNSVSADAKITTINNQIKRLNDFEINKIDNNEKELATQISIYKEKIDTTQQLYIDTISPLQTQLTTLQEQKSNILALGKNKTKEIKFIQQGICPTCHQPIDQSTLPTKLQEQQILRSRYKEISAKFDSLTAHIQKISSEMNNSISQLKNSVKSKEIELARIQESNKHQQRDQQIISELESEMNKCKEELLQYNTEIEQYKQLHQFLSVDIKTKILGSYLPILNNKILELSRMLELEYIPEYDESFKCSIKNNSMKDNISINSLSTGQLKMVDMVIILAFLNTIISNISSNVIFLDELFSNLDATTRSILIRALRMTLPKSSSIFIVSHQDLDTDQFNGTIKLSLDNKKESIISILKNKNYDTYEQYNQD